MKRQCQREPVGHPEAELERSSHYQAEAILGPVQTQELGADLTETPVGIRLNDRARLKGEVDIKSADHVHHVLSTPISRVPFATEF